MQIDKDYAERIKKQFEEFMSMSFPSMPEDDELGRCASELLVLDPAVAAKIISATNGNYDAISLGELGRLLSELSLLEARLEFIDINPPEAHLVPTYQAYVSTLLKAGRFLFSAMSTTTNTL